MQCNENDDGPLTTLDAGLRPSPGADGVRRVRLEGEARHGKYAGGWDKGCRCHECNMAYSHWLRGWGD